MTASDEFRQKLKAGELLDALTLALGEAIELNITTWVSSEKALKSNLTSVDQPLPGHRMHTRINLVDGDIENEIGTEFMSAGPYTELREFHLQQVQQGRQIIQQNLESLQQMFLVLSRVQSEIPQDTRRLSGEETHILPPSESSQNSL